MNIINMSMRPVQVNMKFLNSLPPEWSKFMTGVKLARDLHTTNFDQLYSYLEQHEAHSNETRLLRERYQDPLAFVANFNQPPSHINNYISAYNTTQFPQQTNTMIPQVHSPQSYSPMNAEPHLSQPQIRDDPIAYLNKAMAFLLAVVALKFPLTNNQLRTSSNLRNHATIQDGREGRQGLLNVIIVKVKDTWLGTLLSLKGQGMLHGLSKRQCWLKHRNLSEDLDAYDSDYDDVSNAKAVLMANLSNYGSDVILEDFKQTLVIDFIDNEITSDNNIIPYSQYLQETQQAAVQDTNLYAQQDSMILSVIEQMSE
ncbi:hypothetical protein Tco_0593501 [Tanacetum coccineum]